MRPSSLLIAAASFAVVLASCGSSSTSAHPHAAAVPVATPAEQAAALQATSSFRSVMATAGQSIAAQVTTLDADARAGDVAGAATAANSALLSYDSIRAYAQSNGVSSTTRAPIDDRRLLGVLSALRAGQPVASETSQMVSTAPLLEVLLSRVILAPSTVALRAQDAVAWIAETAPSAYGGSSPTPGATPADCAATLAMARAAYRGLVPLGTLVATKATAKAGADLRALNKTMAGDPSPLQVVQAADASLASLGQLAGQLAGFGQGGEYQ